MNRIGKLMVIIVLTMILPSCKSYKADDFKIVNGLQLGQPYDVFTSSYENLGIKRGNMTARPYCFSGDDLTSFVAGRYYTDIFNFSNYRYELGEGIYGQYMGIIEPITINGSDYVTELAVLICRTGILTMDVGIEPEVRAANVMMVDQTVPKELVDDIRDIYIKKYGLPQDTLQLEEVVVFALRDSQLHRVSEQRPGKCYFWETQTMLIKLYEGATSMSYVSNPYIYYKIKYDVVEKLKLDKAPI